MSTLTYREIDGYKYVVEAPYVAAWPEMAEFTIETRWYSLKAGVLTVYPGYAWDGASGPTFDTPATRKGALEHDVFYQMIRAGQVPDEMRPVGDNMLFRRMTEYPSAFQLWGKIRAVYFFAAVRAAGWWSTRRREIEPQDRIHVV